MDEGVRKPWRDGGGRRAWRESKERRNWREGGREGEEMRSKKLKEKDEEEE